MPTTPSNQDPALFSDSDAEKQVEINFAKRLLHYVGGLNVAEIHELVNSGEFNNIFPALDDEATCVPPRRFEDLKPFDYQAWANRNRITRDKLDLRKELVNLPDVIRAAVESCRPLIDQRQHELTVTMSQEAIYLDADRVRLTQVIINLLNNAAKYTPNPGHIWLSVELAGDTVEVRVKDTGGGIAPENLPHLFDLFYRVDPSFTRSEAGLGLGLFLVHRLVEMHGGKVEVHSAGINRGSEFIVQLPVLPHPFEHTEP